MIFKSFFTHCTKKCMSENMVYRVFHAQKIWQTVWATMILIFFSFHTAAAENCKNKLRNLSQSSPQNHRSLTLSLAYKNSISIGPNISMQFNIETYQQDHRFIRIEISAPRNIKILRKELAPNKKILNYLSENDIKNGLIAKNPNTSNLILSRLEGKSLWIGDSIQITIISIDSVQNTLQLAVTAPPRLSISQQAAQPRPKRYR